MKRPRARISNGQKRCNRCRTFKDPTEFYLRSNCALGVAAVCGECKRAEAQAKARTLAPVKYRTKLKTVKEEKKAQAKTLRAAAEAKEMARKRTERMWRQTCTRVKRQLRYRNALHLVDALTPALRQAFERWALLGYADWGKPLIGGVGDDIRVVNKRQYAIMKRRKRCDTVDK
jgi:hypothetical protein